MVEDVNPYYSGEGSYAEEIPRFPSRRPRIKEEFFTRDKVIEIFLACILVILLVLATIFVLSLSEQDSSPTHQTIIKDSYNVNSYNTYSPPVVKPVPAPVVYHEISYVHTCPVVHISTPLKYSSHGRYVVNEGLLGNKIDEYYVYVTNTDHLDGYFTVRFYFEDYYGHESSEKLTYYIREGEKKTFSYKDIYHEGDRFYRWRYEVTPEREVEKTYSNCH